jgi:16S rRNA (uracil1498-N3)-methyltransferase
LQEEQVSKMIWAYFKILQMRPSISRMPFPLQVFKVKDNVSLMRLHRFYLPEIDVKSLENKAEMVIKDQRLIHQIVNVFRFRINDRILIFSGSGSDYLAMIKKNKPLTVEIIEKKENKKPPEREVILFQSIIKKDHFEIVAEKTTEIGISKIVPLLSQRSEKKNVNKDRINKIIIEATEQSGRNYPSQLMSISTLENALNFKCRKIAFHVDDELPRYFCPDKENSKNEPLGIFIGPEGGWTDKEIKLFKKNNVTLYHLGDTILRSETAAIAACTITLL